MSPGWGAPDPAGETTPRRPWDLAALALVLLHGALAWLARVPGVTNANDDSVYLLLAESLRRLAYQDWYLLSPTPHIQYPPGWPGMLAATGWLTGGSLTAAFLLVALLSSVALWWFWGAASRVLPRPVAFLALLGAATAATVLTYGGRLFSEAAFLAWSMLALRASVEAGRDRRWLWVAGVAALGSALVRTVGLALIAGLVVEWLLARRWKPALALSLSTAVLLGAWLARAFAASEKVLGRSYGADLGAQLTEVGAETTPWIALALRALRQLASLIVYDLPVVLPFMRIPGTAVDNILWLIALGGLGAWGLVLLWRRWPAAFVYLALSFAILGAWTWTQRRLLVPLQPFVLLALLLGAHAVWHRFGRLAGAFAGALVLIGLPQRGWLDTAGMVRDGLACDRDRQYESPSCYTPEQIAFFAAARYVRDSLPPGTPVATDREASFAWHSGTPVVYTMSAMARPLSPPEALRAEGVSYLVVSSASEFDRTLTARWLEPGCAEFRVEATLPPRTYLFALGGTPEDNACGVLTDLAARGREEYPGPLPVGHLREGQADPDGSGGS